MGRVTIFNGRTLMAAETQWPSSVADRAALNRNQVRFSVWSIQTSNRLVAEMPPAGVPVEVLGFEIERVAVRPADG
jgi:hypothetical protein